MIVYKKNRRTNSLSVNQVVDKATMPLCKSFLTNPLNKFHYSNEALTTFATQNPLVTTKFRTNLPFHKHFAQIRRSQVTLNKISRTD